MVAVSEIAALNPLVGTGYVTINVVTNLHAFHPGSISYALYDGIGTGNLVSDLTSNARFPNDPSSEKQMPSFEGDSNRADGYGAVMRGYLIPPVAGSYTFWIATDDNGELWLSTSTNPAQHDADRIHQRQRQHCGAASVDQIREPAIKRPDSGCRAGLLYRGADEGRRRERQPRCRLERTCYGQPDQCYQRPIPCPLFRQLCASCDRLHGFGAPGRDCRRAGRPGRRNRCQFRTTPSPSAS